MAKKYVVMLTANCREVLEWLVKKSKAAGWELGRAVAGLPFDLGPEWPGWTDGCIAEGLAALRGAWSRGESKP